MHPAVISVVCKPDYVLSVVFDNDECGVLDMSPYLDFGVFKKLLEPGAFETAHVSFGTIAWKSGADLAPEFVYEKCLKANMKKT
ncbi:DUF2442 domain-containing protein [Candidatus Spongiihabitans sp.]|uniref:DUF2442 domain-containing protein n=1 Tax=Candidatus Spongiihabitans sp. TaxID=3101308 RepID=UPI003C702A11